jgi:lipopolysaccharide/colanic/teichoic acid biosynthesis glycosyltransferase
VNVEPELLASNEKIRLAAGGKIVGFRRLYADSAELTSVPEDWPTHLFINTKVLAKLLNRSALPLSFSEISQRCRSNGLTPAAANVGGIIVDLDTEEGLLHFCGAQLNAIPARRLHRENTLARRGTPEEHGKNIRREPRLVGQVLLGQDARISPDVTIIGPTIIGRSAHIEPGAIISSSIIGPEVHVPRNQFVRHMVIPGPQFETKGRVKPKSSKAKHVSCSGYSTDPKERAHETFRKWPRLSYARFFKRTVDCVVAIFVLTLFAPIIPLVALAIKLTSPGPVFFKDKRQGLHGKTFNCLKFRTMRVGADKIQDRLRAVSQVDGPQFKIENDPRINAVGRFLRETYIDEIPQFLNVLCGQMSVVGPRPSPESENMLCPSWRDARLSVRPGVTGLWQICRTREPMKDFQEWIHYDTKYVRSLSLKVDLWVCWRTFKKMVDQFISQF